MPLDNDVVRKLMSRDLMDVMIRLGLIAFLVVMCARIFEPFQGLVLWALILAVALYPLHQQIAKRLGGRQGTVATLVVLIGLLVIGLPTVILGSSFASHIREVYSALANNQVAIQAPDPSVASWPFVGKKIYAVWDMAAKDLPGLIETLKPQVGNYYKYLLSIAASTAGGIFKFLGSLIIAGIIMAYGRPGSQAIERILGRLAGSEQGARLARLSTATIRSVAMGVVGVALIQAVLLGMGFIWAGVPAAGVLALFVLLLGIAQLPAAIISIPAIAYIWWTGDSTTMNIVFTVYLLVGSMADNVLKPLLLGRGVDAPMPIILLGALGGMISGGIIGLFIGAVLLAVGYQIFMDWVADQNHADKEPAVAPS
jgi:predicted PurR-regulated permease PerM